MAFEEGPSNLSLERFSISPKDEFGELFQSFIKMNEKLIGTYKQLEEHKKQLEQKTQELELIQNKLIQTEKIAAVGELTAGIAHELNNPIGGILGYAQFILEKMKKQAESGDQTSLLFSKYIEFIANESKRCRKVIQNLLQFSRSSKMEFSLIDVNVVLSDTIDIILYQIRLEEIKFKRNYFKDLPLINGDAVQLQQVFMNILINAIKSIPKGRIGEIEVSTHLTKENNKEFVEIRIKDNGRGIPEEYLEKIFHPFFTTRPTGEGTGLGLSLSYGIVKEHSGHIRVETKEQIGSMFIILLPVMKK